MEYTPRESPRPPKKDVVNSWVRSSWRCIDSDLVKKGLELAGLSGEVENTFIAKHDVTERT